jgi:hypothetical protein
MFVRIQGPTRIGTHRAALFHPRGDPILPCELYSTIYEHINNTLAVATMFHNGGRPSFQEVFEFIRDYLKQLGDELDPYKSAKARANEKPLVAVTACIKRMSLYTLLEQ